MSRPGRSVACHQYQILPYLWKLSWIKTSDSLKLRRSLWFHSTVLIIIYTFKTSRYNHFCINFNMYGQSFCPIITMGRRWAPNSAHFTHKLINSLFVYKCNMCDHLWFLQSLKPLKSKYLTLLNDTILIEAVADFYIKQTLE